MKKLRCGPFYWSAPVEVRVAELVRVRDRPNSHEFGYISAVAGHYLSSSPRQPRPPTTHPARSSRPRRLTVGLQPLGLPDARAEQVPDHLEVVTQLGQQLGPVRRMVGVAEVAVRRG